MDVEESKRWWEARRWPEDHPERVAMRREWEEDQVLGRLGRGAGRRIGRALWTGRRLDSDAERAVLVSRAERTLASRFGGMPPTVLALLWLPLQAFNLLLLELHHLSTITLVAMGATVFGATVAAAAGLMVVGRRRVRRALEANRSPAGDADTTQPASTS